MPGTRRYTPTSMATLRAALGLLILALLVGCDSTPTVAPTPIATPASSATATTVPLPSPTASAAPPTAAPTQPPDSIGAWSRTIRWRRGDHFLLGVNYAYYHYGNDFGANAWGSYGVHDPATYKTVDADFAKMQTLGINSVRWFVFTDARAGITFDAAGLPTGIDDFVFKDFDAALEIAQKHNIAINFVLLDFHLIWDAQVENGVQLGGHTSMIATPEGQQALVHNVFEPIFKRYANRPAILSWEVMNEPEWTLADSGNVDRDRISHPLTLASFRAFAQMTIDAIHSIAHSYATIGCADMKWARNWVGLGLDYYQIHYYDWMKPFSTDNLFATPAESLKLDRPIVVGEFPAGGSTVAELPAFLDTWYTNGYAGAWPWSFRPDTTYGTPDPATYTTWAASHKSVVEIPPAP